MRKLITVGIAAAFIGIAAARGFAHFNIILPADYGVWQARKGEQVKYRFIWGHGYEHIWFDATLPDEFVAIAPSGGKTDLKGALAPIKVKGADGKEYRAYEFAYTPRERGDHILAMKAAMLWDEEAGVFLQDFAKSVLHVQDKLNWDRKVGHKLELVPLSRPYGLQKGGTIQMMVLLDGKPLPGCEVEFEKFQPACPDEDDLPGEEFITYEAKSDPNGIVTFGLTEEGWFALTAVRDSGKKIEKEGHEGDLVYRATFWINVTPFAGIKH